MCLFGAFGEGGAGYKALSCQSPRGLKAKWPNNRKAAGSNPGGRAFWQARGKKARRQGEGNQHQPLEACFLEPLLPTWRAQGWRTARGGGAVPAAAEQE